MSTRMGEMHVNECYEWVYHNMKYSWSLFPILSTELQNPGNFLRQGHLSFVRTFPDQAWCYVNRAALVSEEG